MTDLTPAQIAEARELYAKGLTPHAVAQAMNRFKRNMVTSAQVREVVPLREAGIFLDPEVRAAARSLRLEGLTPREISERLGIPLRSAKTACDGLTLTDAQYAAIRIRTAALRRQNMRGKHKGAKPVAAANEASALQAAAKHLIKFPRREPVEVPRWVPDHLYERFEHDARLYGEEIAASLARQLKAGGSVARL